MTNNEDLELWLVSVDFDGSLIIIWNDYVFKHCSITKLKKLTGSSTKSAICI